MNYRSKEDYLKMREHQAQLFKHKQTPMDLAVSDVMYCVSHKAEQAVRTGNLNVCMQAVALGTGTGKSTSAYAYLANSYLTDPDFAGAIVVPTIQMGIEAQTSIEQLSGIGSTTLYTSLHKDKGVDRAKAYEKLGHMPDRPVNKADLKSSRIVIVCHAQLLRELKFGVDEGTLYYLGKPRNVVYIDEHPELVDVVSCTPAHVQALHDVLVKNKHGHPWIPILANLISRMNKVMDEEGAQYQAAHLLSVDEATPFDADMSALLWELTDKEFSEELRRNQMDSLAVVKEFCCATAKGCAFYSRGNGTFFSYRLHFPSTYPGFVLLDATSDLTGLVQLHPQVRPVEVPKVRYDNLGVYTMSFPTKLRKKKDVLAKMFLGREYGQLIRHYVLANTMPGDEVLVVVWKGILTLELIEESDDPKRPLDWEGRKVNTQNWGAGVGLNKYKHKTHVFMFGEYFPRSSSNIAVTQAWLQKPMSDVELQAAVARRATGDTYLPKGVYGDTCIGHMLRWVKQLAMRGTAREIDEFGNCKPMKLFTTMDLALLIENIERLFPGAPMPQPASMPNGIPLEKTNKREAFVNVFHSAKERWCFGADELEAATGIQQRRVTSEFRELSTILIPLGWKVVAAKELRKPGRMPYVINEAKRGRLELLS